MFVIVKVPADDTSAKSADMKERLAPRPAGYVPYGIRENGCERERLDAVDALNCTVRYAVEHKLENPFAKEFVNGPYGTGGLQFSGHKGEPDPRDIFVTIYSDHVSPQTMHEITKLIAVLSDTDRDIHVNII